MKSLKSRKWAQQTCQRFLQVVKIGATENRLAIYCRVIGTMIKALPIVPHQHECPPVTGMRVSVFHMAHGLV